MMNQGTKILIIDDDSRNVFALNAVLKAQNLSCVSASNAEVGLEMLKDDKEIGLVLMDMMMPDMDGYEAIAEMKKDMYLNRIPVISVTAQAMIGDKERCLNAGADGYVSKPIRINELMRLINKLM